MRSCVVLLVLLVLAAPAAGQDRPAPSNQSEPDFSFSQPRISLTGRGTWLFARAGSDWYDFVTNQLTLEKSDFNAPGFGIDAGFAVGRRVELQFTFDYSRTSTVSEYRDFVDNNRLPIEQETTLWQTNFGGNVKVALTERGREVSRFVWVPRTIVPYVGAGVGALSYNLKQVGDFIDILDPDLPVFPAVFESDGWTPSVQVFGGVDVRVFKRLYVTVDGKYLWASTDLDRDWIDFEPIDLAGFRLSGGVTVMF